MNNFEFDQDHLYQPVSSPQRKNGPLLVRLMAKMGVTDSTTANYILLGIGALLLFATMLVLSGVFNPPTRDTKAESKAILMMQNAQ